MQTLEIRSQRRDQFIDITREVQAALDQSRIENGVVVVYSPHTTAGVTINEHADPAVAVDILYVLDKHVTWSDPAYRHTEGNAASHVKASLMGSSALIPVEGGRLTLGTWQGIFFCEFDGPRRRRVELTFLPAG
jgi:secondary thiamine-phosphate synthase enzyme